MDWDAEILWLNYLSSQSHIKHSARMNVLIELRNVFELIFWSSWLILIVRAINNFPVSESSQQHPSLSPGSAGAMQMCKNRRQVQCSINSDTSSCVSVSNQSVSSSRHRLAVVTFIPPSLPESGLQGLARPEKPKKAASTARERSKNGIIDKLMCSITLWSLYLRTIKIIETLILFAVQSH